MSSRKPVLDARARVHRNIEQLSWKIWGDIRMHAHSLDSQRYCDMIAEGIWKFCLAAVEEAEAANKRAAESNKQLVKAERLLKKRDEQLDLLLNWAKN